MRCSHQLQIENYALKTRTDDQDLRKENFKKGLYLWIIQNVLRLVNVNLLTGIEFKPLEFRYTPLDTSTVNEKRMENH